MDKSNLYKNIKTKKVFFSQEDYIHYVKILKVLFRLEIVDENCVIDIAAEFRPFFV